MMLARHYSLRKADRWMQYHQQLQHWYTHTKRVAYHAGYVWDSRLRQNLQHQAQLNGDGKDQQHSRGISLEPHWKMLPSLANSSPSVGAIPIEDAEAATSV